MQGSLKWGGFSIEHPAARIQPYVVRQWLENPYFFRAPLAPRERIHLAEREKYCNLCRPAFSLEFAKTFAVRLARFAITVRIVVAIVVVAFSLWPTAIDPAAT